MKFRSRLVEFLGRRGRMITRYPLRHYFKQFGISCVLDVGANVGQYALHLRRLGYRGRIISFEPFSEAFQTLQSRSKRDDEWTVVNIALGSENSELTLNIANNSVSSSLLSRPTDVVKDAYGIEFVSSEVVSCKRLDSILDDVCDPADTLFLKMDTQGFEREVLSGVDERLARITGLQMELSLVAMYEGEPLLEEMIDFVRSRGFEPYWIVHGAKNLDSLQLYQVDVLFFRKNSHDTV